MYLRELLYGCCVISNNQKHNSNLNYKLKPGEIFVLEVTSPVVQITFLNNTKPYQDGKLITLDTYSRRTTNFWQPNLYRSLKINFLIDCYRMRHCCVVLYTEGGKEKKETNSQQQQANKNDSVICIFPFIQQNIATQSNIINLNDLMHSTPPTSKQRRDLEPYVEFIMRQHPK